MSNEQWREVARKGDQTWEVSDLGRVRSVRVLSQMTNKDGYRKVNLGRGCQRYVHRLVARAFLRTPDGGPEEWWTVDHIDYEPVNNRLENLRYMTAEENTARQRRHDGEEIDPNWPDHSEEWAAQSA